MILETFALIFKLVLVFFFIVRLFLFNYKYPLDTVAFIKYNKDPEKLSKRIFHLLLNDTIGLG